MKNEVEIKIARANEGEVVVVPSGNLGNINKKLKDINQLVMSINLVVVLSLMAIIVSVIGLFLDQMRYNNVVYKEYSQKTESVENIQNINKELLEQNKKNQEIIIELEKQILKK